MSQKKAIRRAAKDSEGLEFSTESAGTVLAGLSGRVHSLWCDGCRQEPTMSVQRAERERDKPHEGCPAGSGTWRLLVEVAPGGGVDWSAVLKARSVCERVFYWLDMGDEGPETELPCPEEIAELPPAVEELLEEARVAARLLGGLREEDEEQCEFPHGLPCGASRDVLEERTKKPCGVCARVLAPALQLHDLLLLVERAVPVLEIVVWTNAQQERAREWATLVHLSASDNPVKVPSEPKHARAWKPKRSASGTRRAPRAQSGHVASEKQSQDLFSSRPPPAKEQEAEKEAPAESAEKHVLVPAAMLMETHRRLDALRAELEDVDVPGREDALSAVRVHLGSLVNWHGLQVQLAGLDLTEKSAGMDRAPSHEAAADKSAEVSKAEEPAPKKRSRKVSEKRAEKAPTSPTCGAQHPVRREVRCDVPKDSGAHADPEVKTVTHSMGTGAKAVMWIGPRETGAHPDGGRRDPEPESAKEQPSARHTPGPWSRSDADDDGRSKRCAIRVVAGPVTVATVTYERDDSEAREQARANVQLITSAPAMKDLLLEMLGDIRGLEDTPLYWGFLARWEMKAADVLLAAGEELPGKEVRHAE